MQIQIHSVFKGHVKINHRVLKTLLKTENAMHKIENLLSGANYDENCAVKLRAQSLETLVCITVVLVSVAYRKMLWIV